MSEAQRSEGEQAGQTELDELRSAVRAFLAESSSEARVRDLIEDPGAERDYDHAVWTTMADQLGLHSLVIPQQYGGDGFGYTELRVVLEEMGRTLLPSPFLPTVVLAGATLLASDDEDAKNTHLPAIAKGATTATLAVAEADGAWSTAGLRTLARRSADGWVLDGEKTLVPYGASAELILVVAATEAGPTLFSAPGHAKGLRRTNLPTLDGTRPLATLTFSGTPATVIGTQGTASGVLRHVLDLASTALAAEQVGSARACLEASSSYARERIQFGRPIGTFQAVKHKCADMLVSTELAQAAAIEAANAADGIEGAPSLGVAAAVAHSVCSEALMFVAAENIQVHGGIGFTWEHPAHLYYRRAKSSQLLLGGPSVYHERLLDRLGV